MRETTMYDKNGRNVSNYVKILYETPTPPTDLISEPVLFEGPGYDDLIFEYQCEDKCTKIILRFHDVTAVQIRAYYCCANKYLDAYEKLIERKFSPWKQEIESAMEKQNELISDIHHYLIYIDSVGSFEFIAYSWELIEESSPLEEMRSENVLQ